MRTEIIKGKVIRGKGRGRKLGFPTANFKIYKEISQGVYISVAKLRERPYNSLTFIGNAKTFDEKEIRAETYILDFNKNIYGKFLTIRLIKKLRGNKKFKEVDELIKQMDKDLETAKEYFKK